jgi:hypothetical protein
MMTEDVVSPPSLLAVRLYVVKSYGLTFRLPVEATLPMPLSRIIVSAFLTTHCSTAGEPFSTLEGVTLNDTISGTSGAAGSTTWAAGTSATHAVESANIAVRIIIRAFIIKRVSDN